MRAAIARAIEFEDRAYAQTRWSDAAAAFPASPTGAPPGLTDTRTAWVPAPADRAFTPIRRIGGSAGWYAANGLWQVRGLIDQLIGGVGLRRGRRDPEQVAPGDTLDFWRVERYEPDRLLRLRAEMRLPGRAWLEFEATPERGGTRIRQTAQFDPDGPGRAHLLVCPAADPRRDLPAHAAVDRRPSLMARYVATVESPRPPDQVFGYVADFTTNAEWDPGTISAERVGDGAGRPGRRVPARRVIPGPDVGAHRTASSNTTRRTW